MATRMWSVIAVLVFCGGGYLGVQDLRAEPQTHENFLAQAAELRNILSDLETLRQRMIRAYDSHTANGYSNAITGGYVKVCDAAAEQAGDCPTGDTSGRIQGLNFTPAEYIDGIKVYTKMESMLQEPAPGGKSYQEIISEIVSPATAR